MMWIIALFALYGICTFVWKVYGWSQTYNNVEKGQFTIVLSVRNAEPFIEGTLRELVAISDRVQEITVIVITGSTGDATPQIIQKMQEQFEIIQLVTALTHTEVSAFIGAALTVKEGSGIYFDVASSDGARNAVSKVRALCGV